jgi:cell division septation protein DedD
VLNLSFRGSVQSAPPHSRGFDTDTQLTAATAGAFVQAGFTFAVRYLSLGTPESPGDLSSQEVQDILGSGLALMAVQHAPEPGAQLNAQFGLQYGRNAVLNAQSAGLPAGMNLWLDLEGVNSGTSAGDVTAYCNAWAGEVSGARYLPGLYLGYDAILDSEQLDALEIKYYWRSGSDASQPSGSSLEYPYPAQGFCMVQSISSSYAIDHVTYDLDVIQSDNLGNTPMWLAPRTHHLFSSGPTVPESSAHPPKASSASPKTRSASRIAVFALLAILLYAAGVFTGPFVVPEGQAALAAIVKKLPGSKPTPAAAPSKTPAGMAGSAAPGVATGVAPAPEAPAVPTPPVDLPAAARPSTPAVEGSPSSPRSVLVGSFRDGENAESLARTLESAGFGHPAVSTAVIGGKQWTIVRLGPYGGPEEADRVAAQLKDKYHLHPSVLREGD